jgi:uncharacterized membrane protein (DUF373 family)
MIVTTMNSNSFVTTQITKAIGLIEQLIYLAIGLLLSVMALETFYQAISTVFTVDLQGNVTKELVNVLNEALFVIILLELLGTVLNHLQKGGFQLRPFLIIGIVSSVRRILVLGAQLSTLRSLSLSHDSRGAIIELLADAAVVLILTLALFLNGRLKRSRPQSKPVA